MNPLRTVCLMMGVLALASANSAGPRPMGMNSNRNTIKHNSMKPTSWMSISTLESLPSLKEIKLEKLEELSAYEGADLINQLYHLSQATQALEPTYAPKASEIPAFLVTPDNQKIDFQLNELPRVAREQSHCGKQDVTVFITGLPSKLESVKKATRSLVHAYMQRYNENSSSSQNSASSSSSHHHNQHNKNKQRNDSDEDDSSSQNPSGCLIVVKFGDTISDFEEYATVDTEKVGKEVGKVLVQLLEKTKCNSDNIHLIGSNLGANIAGAAGRQYTKETNHQLRRITGLDPVKSFAKDPETLTGLARGDAEFVDAIHTTANSMGTSARSADVDFYPEGPSEAVPGADNIVESSMRATRYFAESVVPGNERNFPAESAHSLDEYKSSNTSGRRIYMGINTNFKAEGDYMLQVNNKSPFGRSTPAQKQKNSHGAHKSWKMSQDEE
ncbi:vitellogenin-2-like [Musca vetustissima]|uniref:vitellogenin-2-like n=1 Tax=Musca vetustissima TaxID=27455 RepID=UPI002AB7C164|nr:vitellogenin-2-like [Musca vetustissima]